jgi:hypothetical protein
MELVGILIGHMYFFLMFKVRPIIIKEGRGQCIHSSSSLKNLLKNILTAFYAGNSPSPVNK